MERQTRIVITLLTLKTIHFIGEIPTVVPSVAHVIVRDAVSVGTPELTGETRHVCGDI